MPPAKKHGSTTNVLGKFSMRIDPLECPFREFRDHEITPDTWGLGTAAFRANLMGSKVGKPTAASSALAAPMWEDDETQPLPKSIRNYLHGWERAEELAETRWDCALIVSDESAIKMSVVDYQLTYAQVLLRSSFCRKVLSACFMLERTEGLQVEHQWDNFNSVLGPEGWRARYLIYSPGLKPGGGLQHRPTLSRNGCYLVRLYHLGAWRCVWVSDQVPIDATGAPLLPFSPLSSPATTVVRGRSAPTTVTAKEVHLWPLLLCKALLKIAAPEMIDDEKEERVTDEMEEDIFIEDEEMSEFDLMHCLTGGFSLNIKKRNYEDLWRTLTEEVKVFYWEDDDDMASSSVKTKSTKKPNAKEKPDKEQTKGSMASIHIVDTKHLEPFVLPGISPGLEMALIVTMVRDVPIKKPLPEPEVPYWKLIRWVQWARNHGLYEAYECPRTKFLKVNGLMKLSYAPHLLDVQSTESITYVFREEHQADKQKKTKDAPSAQVQPTASQNERLAKEELREWIQYNAAYPLIESTNIVYHPSLYVYASAANNPPVRSYKAPNKNMDVQASKSSPLYLQIDGPDEIILMISLNMLHPRILTNTGYPISDYIEKGYILLECFDWFIDTDLPLPWGYVQTRGYDSVEVTFTPGRHYCRLWLHSRMWYHVSLLSESDLVLGTRDVVQVAATQECPWVARFLGALGTAFSNWIRGGRSAINIRAADEEFFECYRPDLPWDPEVAGYDIHFVHWMFRQALQSVLFKRLTTYEFRVVCMVLRRYFSDPEFGKPPKQSLPSWSLREIIERDPCDCSMPEVHSVEEDDSREIQVTNLEEKPPEGEEVPERPLISDAIMLQLLQEPEPPIVSQICELAGEDMPCALLKSEREKMIVKHEAAKIIQAYWRGCSARKCLNMHVNVTTEAMKLLMDHAFGNNEALSGLMNEFFFLFPGTRHAYSVSSALAGVYGVDQQTGVSPITAKCKWIPFFQGVYYCHQPVKVHFDVHSSLEHSIIQIYDNDTGEMLPQAYNAHITFDVHPNVYGYTVMAHGSLNQPLSNTNEVIWQITVLTSMDHVFHVCDNNELEGCHVMALTPATKLHIDEMYIPNKGNILGGIQISVTTVEAISFRAAATSPDLDIEAILTTPGADGEIQEVARCHGTGEIFWPYIRLKPPQAMSSETLMKKLSTSKELGSVQNQTLSGGKSGKKDKAPKEKKVKSATKLTKPPDFKTYTITIVAPDGWPLPIENWKRIEEVRQDVEVPKIDTAKLDKKGKEAKPATSARDKKKEAEMMAKEVEKVPMFTIHEPLADDAYTEIECAISVGEGVTAKRDDDRDILFATTLRSWDMKEPGRNARGAKIRQEFRDQYLIPPTPSVESFLVEEAQPMETEESRRAPQGPTPATEISFEVEEENLYFTYPEQLKEKFYPLHFVQLCTREVAEESVLLTEEMAEAAKQERNARLEAALERMRELQEYNAQHILGRQDYRCELLEKLLIDFAWNPELFRVMEERNDAIAQEVLERQLSAAKKKADLKKLSEKAKESKPAGTQTKSKK